MKTVVKSFAKINFGLRILNKRDDGFHDLETIFYPVKLYDEILIEIEASDSGYNSVLMRSNKSYIPLTKDNLCYKAIENFFRSYRIRDCYKITIDLKKVIPVGGGLGGGSSNAAAILKFLLKYFKVDITSGRKQILDLALKIGSDVPFFLVMKPCYAEGRGELMKVLPDFAVDHPILIVNPNLHISTKWAFERYANQNNPPKQRQLDSIKTFDPGNVGLFVNDFEDIVFRKYEELAKIKSDLTGNGAIYASMSGTGATMFGVFDADNRKKMIELRDAYNSKGYFTFLG